MTTFTAPHSAEAPSLRHPDAPPAATQFLAPPNAEKNAPAPQVSDRSDSAMHRMRNPFDVA